MVKMSHLYDSSVNKNFVTHAYDSFYNVKQIESELPVWVIAMAHLYCMLWNSAFEIVTIRIFAWVGDEIAKNFTSFKFKLNLLSNDMQIINIVRLEFEISWMF